jgi:alpha-tubulin suppressor-like RCC1 family protein
MKVRKGFFLYIYTKSLNYCKMKKFILYTILLYSITTAAQCWESISNGEQHVMAIRPNGTLWGWGTAGTIGRLGNGTAGSSNVPALIGTDYDWKSVSAGQEHSFGIKDSGTLWAWGSNFTGNLGTGSAALVSNIPVQVGTQTWKMVVAGHRFSIGIRSDGTLWGWGLNENGTVGDGTTINRSVPVLINSSTNWKMVSCNLSRTMAIKEDGTIWAWGLNAPSFGIIGEGGSQNVIAVPTQIDTIQDCKLVAVGQGHYLVIKNDGTLWAWGGGGNGQLGNGTTNASFLPTQVGTDTDWAFVEADAFSSFGIKTNGTLWSWGANFKGRLGNGTTTDLLVPTQIGATTGWAAVSTSYNATVALKTDGSLFAWGSNDFIQYGNGTSTSQSTPLLITTCNLGTADFDKNQGLLLYPNPATDKVNIRFETPQGESQVEIYDLTGRLI